MRAVTALALALLAFLTPHKTSAGEDPPTDTCFTRTLCAIQNTIRWRQPRWDQATCDKVSAGFVASGKRHAFAPGFLASFSVNESELRIDAGRRTTSATGRVANDGGLMGVRCVLSTTKRWWKEDRLASAREPGARFILACINDPVRGMTIDEVLDPATNIELGASILAQIRDDGVKLLAIKIETKDGVTRAVRKVRTCAHRTHPWFAHYNWGARAIEKGPPRHYPHRVAVLYTAFAKAMGKDAPELAGAKFVQDRGQRERRVDKPVGERQRRLFEQILSCSGRCTELARR